MYTGHRGCSRYTWVTWLDTPTAPSRHALTVVGAACSVPCESKSSNITSIIRLAADKCRHVMTLDCSTIQGYDLGWTVHSFVSRVAQNKKELPKPKAPGQMISGLRCRLRTYIIECFCVCVCVLKSVFYKCCTHFAHRDPLLADLRNPLWVVALEVV